PRGNGSQAAIASIKADGSGNGSFCFCGISAFRATPRLSKFWIVGATVWRADGGVLNCRLKPLRLKPHRFAPKRTIFYKRRSAPILRDRRVLGSADLRYYLRAWQLSRGPIDQDQKGSFAVRQRPPSPRKFYFRVVG